ncbi:hypothetical protein HK105_206990 [Polyrhizophydium stewartii]|uniref:Late embryogenesis abundant protein LEA-2 subgroup domain-containing protein n=1 Tax=Polyrhizophydium stewartii TaxID=2732419 RepID=A0ABR4N1Y6_9FUNG
MDHPLPPPPPSARDPRTGDALGLQAPRPIPPSTPSLVTAHDALSTVPDHSAIHSPTLDGPPSDSEVGGPGRSLAGAQGAPLVAGGVPPPAPSDPPGVWVMSQQNHFGRHADPLPPAHFGPVHPPEGLGPAFPPHGYGHPIPPSSLSPPPPDFQQMPPFDPRFGPPPMPPFDPRFGPPMPPFDPQYGPPMPMFDPQTGAPMPPFSPQFGAPMPPFDPRLSFPPNQYLAQPYSQQHLPASALESTVPPHQPAPTDSGMFSVEPYVREAEQQHSQHSQPIERYSIVSGATPSSGAAGQGSRQMSSSTLLNQTDAAKRQSQQRLQDPTYGTPIQMQPLQPQGPKAPSNKYAPVPAEPAEETPLAPPRNRRDRRYCCCFTTRLGCGMFCCLIILLVLGGLAGAGYFLYPRYPSFYVTDPYVPAGTASLQVSSGEATQQGIQAGLAGATAAAPYKFWFPLATNITVYSPNYITIGVDQIEFTATLQDSAGGLLTKVTASTNIGHVDFASMANTTVVVPFNVTYTTATATDPRTDPAIVLLANSCNNKVPIKLHYDDKITITVIAWTGFKPSTSGVLSLACPDSVAPLFAGM